MDGLVAPFHVDDRETSCAQSDAAIEERAVVIGAPMSDRPIHRFDERRVGLRFRLSVKNAANSTHLLFNAREVLVLRLA